jgi:ATP-dependent Clp protease adaptor protein ClpS
MVPSCLAQGGHRRSHRRRWQWAPDATPFRAAILVYIAWTAVTHRHKVAFAMSTRVTMTDSAPPGGGTDTTILTKPKARTQRPPLYKVMLLNDDYTPMEFVVHVLERFFGLTHAQAFDIMLTVHKKGLAVVGVFSHEVAETKVAQVMDFARRHQHPLQCTMEKE